MSTLSLIKGLTPPLLWDSLKRFKKNRFGFSGSYTDYAAALAACGTSGYHEEQIVTKTLERVLALKSECQRDRMTCDVRTQQVLSGLLLPVAHRLDSQAFRVLDFGGALGNLYFQVERFLPSELALTWHVVDTPLTASAGRLHLENERLRFGSDLAEAPGPFDVIIASSSLQYMMWPEDTLRQLVGLGARYLLINRTPFLPIPTDRLTVQRVPPQIYSGAYPAWFFSESRWLELLQQVGLALRMRWILPNDLKQLDGAWYPDQGMLLERAAQG